MGRRGRRWPSGTSAGDGGGAEASRAEAQGSHVFDVHHPVVVANPVRPSRLFAELVAAIGLPEEEVRFVVCELVDDPTLTPEALTASQLAHLGPALLRSIQGLVDWPEAERRAAHDRLESLLRAAAHR
jgi:hypothetical protein